MTMHQIAPGKPALDVVADMSAHRVFDDRSGDHVHLWFEVSPGRFWVGGSWGDAVELASRFPDSVGATFRQLHDAYPRLTDVTHLHP